MYHYLLYYSVKFSCNVQSHLQKSPTPILDDIPVPLFESEAKKTQVKVVTKATTAPTIEGTSVMPRQRPKGNSTTPLNLTNIPLALNPSPTTVKKSQSPVTSIDNQFQAFPQKSNLAQPNYPATTTAYSTVFPANAQPFYPQEAPEKDLDNLFQSSVYPDPFRDETLSKEFEAAKAVAEVDMTVTSPVAADGKN